MKEKLYVVVKKEPIGHCFNLGQTIILKTDYSENYEYADFYGLLSNSGLEVLQTLRLNQVELIGEI